MPETTNSDSTNREINPESLSVTPLTNNDLPDIEWSGNQGHTDAVRKALERVEGGGVDYLAVRDKDGKPIAIGGVDYEVNVGTGTLWQLATREDFRGLGIGSRLIAELEQKIINRGISSASLSVETNNPRAKALYERLGYKQYGQDQESWQEIDNDGRPSTYHAQVDLLRKELG